MPLRTTFLQRNYNYTETREEVLDDIYDDSELIVHGPSYLGKPIGFLEPASAEARHKRRQARRGEVSPHERPGHLAPDEQTDPDGRIYGAIHGLNALNGDDNLSHT